MGSSCFSTKSTQVTTTVKVKETDQNIQSRKNSEKIIEKMPEQQLKGENPKKEEINKIIPNEVKQKGDKSNNINSEKNGNFLNADQKNPGTSKSTNKSFPVKVPINPSQISLKVDNNAIEHVNSIENQKRKEEKNKSEIKEINIDKYIKMIEMIDKKKK